MAHQKYTYFVLRDGTQFGDAETVELTEGQALGFCRAGELVRYDGGKKPKRSTLGRKPAKGGDDARALKAQIRDLEADLAAAKEGKGGADAKALQDAIARAEKAEEELKSTVPMAQLKAAQDEKLAIETDLQAAREGMAGFQQEIAALNLRVTEAEQLATDAASETESLERVIALIEDVQPELVAQVKETVTAEYQAAAAAAQQG